MQKQSNRVSQNLAEEIVFKAVSKEPPPWSVCGWKSSQSASLFLIQSFVVFILILTSIVCINLSRSCDEKRTVWVALSSSVVGFILPIPRY